MFFLLGDLDFALGELEIFNKALRAYLFFFCTRITGFHIAPHDIFLLAKVASPWLSDFLVFIKLELPVHLLETSLAEKMKGDFFLKLDCLGIEFYFISCFVLMLLGFLFASVVHFLQQYNKRIDIC